MQPERLTVRLRGSTRLDRYLTATLAHVSRQRIQRHIERGDVLVDGRVVRPSHRLRGGEVVTLPTVVARGLEVASAPADFAVVYEDADLVVVNKPPGLLVHPVGREFRHTLLNGLHHRLRSRGDDADTLGIVHRLDRATSGLLVVAKHLEARRRLARAIEARRVRRLYLAVTCGEPTCARGSIELAIRRDPRRPTRMQALSPEAVAALAPLPAPVSSSGYSDPRRDFRPRPARTDFRLLRRLPGAALLRLELHTGRTHQIRVHLQALGMPLVGDSLYGGEACGTLPQFVRQALHASRLEFEQPTSGERLCFTAPLPADMRDLVATLARRGADGGSG
jgi:23S rRNA pseudouridine1911/1915/1917 synthase